MFLLDIQQAQVAAVRAFLDARKAPGAGALQLIPVLRARVTGVARHATEPRDARGRPRQRVARPRVHDHLSRSSRGEREGRRGRVLDGRPPSPRRAAEVSVEKGIHERFRIDVGDTMRFDVLGRIVEARVTSIRDVDWDDSRSGGFMFVFRPGPLDQAPQTFIGSLKGPRIRRRAAASSTTWSRSSRTSRSSTSARSSRRSRTSVDNVTLAISVVGGLVLFSGVLILIGAVAMTKFQRVYEAAILKTLGASTRMLGGDAALEYGVLGLLAGAVGAVGALALTWGVSALRARHPLAPGAGAAPRSARLDHHGARRHRRRDVRAMMCCARSRLGTLRAE